MRPAEVWAMDWEEHNFISTIRNQFEIEEHITSQYESMNAMHPSEEHLAALKRNATIFNNKMSRAPSSKNN